MIRTIDAHLAALEKRDLKSNVTVYCIGYSSVDSINCLQFQKASHFCQVYCIVLTTVGQTLSTLTLTQTLSVEERSELAS